METNTTAKKGTTMTEVLAVFGFIALIIIGIALAIYATRFIPGAAHKIITTSSNLNNPSGQTPPSDTGYLHVVSTTATNPISTSTTDFNPTPMKSGTWSQPVVPVSQPVKSSTPTPSHTPRAPYGLSDLSTTIIDTGYLSGPTNDSFVSAHVIPPGARPAVKFSIANSGTNSTGPWSFLAHIPTLAGTVFNSPVQASMNPGDHVVFTLGFNQALPGPSQPITVVADPNNQINESSEANNSASAAVTITQTGN
jgi:hypothetical protein